jgi:hypothetical protein
MRQVAAVLGLACLAGCAYNPVELRQAGERHTYQSQRAPRDAAQCLARNAEEYIPAEKRLQGEWRDGRAPGSMEVLVRNQGNTFIVADIRPSASGSEIVLWQNPVMAYRDLHEAMAKGC